jgi:phage terminase Nu1 subunit (DNA packaging protein)
MVTQAEFARLRNVSRKTVSGWKAEGLIVFDRDGGVDVAASKLLLDEMLLRTRNPGGSVEPSSSLPSLTSSRRRKEAASATLKELELQRVNGEYVHVSEIREGWSRIILSIRNAFLGLPSQAHTQLGLTSQQTKGLNNLVHDILKRIVHDGVPQK